MIIATRTLTLRAPDGTQDVPVHLHAPELDDGAWICRYEIGWPEGPRTSFAGGLDAIQAMHLALQKIGLDLHMSSHHASNLLAWGEAGEGYGFPVPRNARDLLVGLDKTFDG